MSTLKFRPQRCGVILAGGDGTRLRPFIRNFLSVDIPKQYINFIGTRSMLQHTFDRAEQVISPECIFTVVAGSHLHFPEVREQLRDRPAQTVVVQPLNRETGPGLLLPLMHLLRSYPNSTVAVFPSDHFILDESLFMAYVRQAFEIVEESPDKIVFLGVEPNEPVPEYSYILPDYHDLDSPERIRSIKAFVEEPSPGIAAQVTALGALWNSMVMVFMPDVLLHLISLSAPSVHRSFQRIYKALRTLREPSVVEQIYRNMAPIDFSRDLLEALDIHSRNQLSVISTKDVFWSHWQSEAHIFSTVKEFGHVNPLAAGGVLDDILNRLPAGLVAGVRASA